MVKGSDEQSNTEKKDHSMKRKSDIIDLVLYYIHYSFTYI